ncbi:MAG TPA: DUF2339 domain-containing protein [Longimicrobium sp.]|nr:DUF2339 domain-containing protein [Longimicrobium sp.]
MTTPLEERLFYAERLLAGLVRERAGVATADDLHLLQSAGAAFARMVQEPAFQQSPAPAAVRMPAPAPAPAAAPLPPPPSRAYPDAYDDDAYDDMVQGPRRRERIEPTAAERWIAAKMNATPGDWIARAGMGLLLFGIAFLCKYSIDQGWITPALRVGAGAAMGAVLIVLGVRTHSRARAFSGLFLGGGIGAWYTATYAAFALYHLVPFPVAFALMSATTAAAFVLALWTGIETLAVVAALGGIGTPFLLSTGTASAPAFVAYLLCILAWTSGTYLARRWRVSFAVATVGTCVALMSALNVLPLGRVPVVARTAVTVGFAGVLLAAWCVFLLPRAWPGRFRASPREQEAHAWWGRLMGVSAERARTVEEYLAVALPFFAVWMSLGAVWEISPRAGGSVGMGVLFVTAFAYVGLRTRLPSLARAHAFTAAAAGAISLAMVSRTVPEAVTVLAVYGALLHACARGEPLGRPMRLLAHAVMALTATAATLAMTTPAELASRLALLSVAVCAYAVAAERVSAVGERFRDVYRLGGHAYAGLLVWALCLPLLYTGGWLAVSLAAFAAFLCWLERQRGGPVSGRAVDGTAAQAMHAVALVTVLGFCGVFGSGAYAWANERAAAQLALIASLIVCAVLVGPGQRRALMAGGAYVLWLITVADQFHGLTADAAFTTGVWAATGLVLLLVALRRREQVAVRLAIGTLGLVCAKLFLVDLASLDPIWRILVFLGVGVAFLGVSYAARSAWLPASEPEPDPAAGVSLAGN